MAIFLCGFMGRGKTTIGKNLAKSLGRGYCDMDELIVKKRECPYLKFLKLRAKNIFAQWSRTL